ncbi:MAG TPA: cation diffusion facilitator family transporter [Candidatus Gemmiger excrementavium]|uniref:Cation diffusion facilitator family transporter n=1 Tax=Candidatus Gemmiger excrementavium TaxID=2838608 RepID=A0A9D2F1Q8_9FIRM|nr:cation diffusion facilitator family transporter [Candidatus Gemmiger excrementavium]
MIELLVRLFVKNHKNTADSAVRTAYGNLACVVSVVCNLLLFLGKTAVGTLAGSVSITADGLNNLSDASSNIISLVGFKLGARPADSGHPYGHARYEYLSGLAVSVMILVIGVELFKESFFKILHPTPVQFGWLTAAVLLGSILVKLWMSRFNRVIGVRIQSETLLAVSVDARNDVITTTSVLVAAVLVHFTGFDRLDGIMGIGVAGFILYSGVQLVRSTINPLLGAAPDPGLVERIEHKAMTYPGVLGVHDLMIHDYGPGNRLVSFHIEMDAKSDVMQSHNVIDTIEKDLLIQDGMVATIHYDPVVTGDSHVDEIRTFLQQQIGQLDPAANVHDLRIVPGPSHTNVIFDCAVPAEYLTDKQRRGAKLVNALRTAVQQKWPDHFCVIKLEPDYAPCTHTQS